MHQLDISKLVMFLHPEPGEENLIFKITNYNEGTQRCYIKPVNIEGWTSGLEPEQLVSIYDLKNTE